MIYLISFLAVIGVIGGIFAVGYRKGKNKVIVENLKADANDIKKTQKRRAKRATSSMDNVRKRMQEFTRKQ